MLCIMVALKVWKHKMRGKRFKVLCDNIATVMVLNAGKTWDKFQESCLRGITFVAATEGFEMKLVHVAGVSNRLPDLLSRWDIDSSAKSKFEKDTAGMLIKEMVVTESMFKFECDW